MPSLRERLEATVAARCGEYLGAADAAKVLALLAAAKRLRDADPRSNDGEHLVACDDVMFAVAAFEEEQK